MKKNKHNHKNKLKIKINMRFDIDNKTYLKDLYFVNFNPNLT